MCYVVARLVGVVLLLVLLGSVAPRVAWAACGNGITDPGEGCDDGNLSDGDGCSSSCAVEPTATPTPTPVPPPTCAAIDLGNELPVSANGTTVGAPSAGATSACATGEGTRNDVIYKWTAPATGYYTIEVTAYSWAALLSVRDGGCFGPELACRATPVASRLVVAATLGQSLTIVVGGTSLQGGSYALSISANPPCAYIQLDAADAVYSSASAATYPPSAPSCVQGATQFSVRQSTDGNDFTVNEAIVQFDTSVLPAGAAVTAGQVVLGDNATNTDNGTLTAEWLDWGGTCDAGDYDRPAQGTTFTVPMADVAAGMQSFALQDFSGVNAGGLTSLRLKIAGDEPTGTNELNFTWRYMTLIVCDPSFPDTPTPTATPTRTPTPPLSGCCVVDSQCSLPPEVESTPVGGGTCIDASNAGACSALGCQTAQFVAHDTCDNGCVVPTPCAGEARYWVGGATENHANPTTWNDPAHWSCSSGGTPGASPPQCVPVGDTYQGLNDCVWDANSGMDGALGGPAGFAWIETSGLCCRNADWTGVPFLRPGAECCQSIGDPPGSPNCNGAPCLIDSDCPSFGVCTHGPHYSGAAFVGSQMYVSGSLLGGFGVDSSASGTLYLTATEGSHSVIITNIPTGNGIDFHGSGNYGDSAEWNLLAEAIKNPQGDMGGSPGANLTFGYGRLNLNGRSLGGYDIRSGHVGDPADAFVLDATRGTFNAALGIRVFHSWSLPSTTFIYGDPPCPGPSSLECAPLTFLEPGASCDPSQWTMIFDGSNLSYYSVNGWPLYPGSEWIVNGTATMEHFYGRTNQCNDGHCPECEGIPRPTPLLTVQGGTTQTVTQQWDVSGIAEVPLIIRSSNPGTAWTLDCTDAHCESDYIILSDSTCIGSCYAGSHSVDAGGNTNWFFTDVPPTPTPTQGPSWTQSPTPTPAPGCCAFAGDNPLGVSCVDNLVVERPVSFEICQYVSHLFLEDAPVLHFNPAVGCDPLGDFSGSCPPPETPLPTPTSTPARCGQLAVFSVAAPSDDGMTLKVGPEYPPPGANGFSVTCSTLEDPGCDIDIGGKLIVGKAFSEGAPLDGSFAVTYTQMRFPTDNGALPAAATVCAAELRLMTAESFGNADQRNFVGRYCTQSFPIVEANWVESFTGDAIAGVSIDAVAAAGAATVLELDDLSGITSAAQTGLCLGVSGGQPTGMNGAAFEASDTPNSIPPQLWVWFNVEEPTPTPTPPPTALPTCAAIDLGNQQPVSANGTTVGAPSAGAASACATGEGTRNDVVYQWTAPASGYYTVQAIAYPFTPVLSVRDGSCNGLEVACSATGSNSQVVIAATMGQTFTIVVEGTSEDGGDFFLMISGNPPCATIYLPLSHAVYTAATSATYPPAAATCTEANGNWPVARSLSAGSFRVNEALLQFDTSIIPAAAAVTEAQLALDRGVNNADDFDLSGEWVDWGGSCAPGDYDQAGTASAFSASMAEVGGGGYYLSLANFDGINPGGLTSIRFAVVGGEPTGLNDVTISYASLNLTVCDPSFPETPTPTATPTRTPTPPLSGCCVVDSECSLPPEVESTPVSGGTCIDASSADACAALSCQAAQFVAHGTCESGCVAPTPCAGASRYWVGGASDNFWNPTSWNDPAHWSCSSGGSPGASPPQCVAVGDAYQGLNDCVWDENSELNGALTAPDGFGWIETSGLCCRNADWTGVPFVRPGAECCLAGGEPIGSPNCNGASCLLDSDCAIFGYVCTHGPHTGSGAFIGSEMYVSGSLLEAFGLDSSKAGTLYLTATEGSHSVIITNIPTGNGIDFHGSGTYGDNAEWNLLAEAIKNPQGDMGDPPGANLTFGYGRLNLNGRSLGGYDIRSGHIGDPADAFILDASQALPNQGHGIRIFNSWSLPDTTFLYGDDPPCGDLFSLECAHLSFLEPGASCDPAQWTMTFDGSNLSYYAIEARPLYPGSELIVNSGATMERIYARTEECSAPHCPDCGELPRPTPVVSVQAGTTQTVTQHWDVFGVAEVPLILRSSQPGTAWTLDCTGAHCESDHIILSDSTCIGSCYAGSHSVDAGGNTNWFFTDAPPTPTPTPYPTWTWAPASPGTPAPTPTPEPAPGCCAFAGDNPLGVSCVDNLVVERPVSFEICQYVSHLFLEDAPVLHFNPAVGCDPLGDFSGSCPPPETPLPTPTSTPARCGQLAVFSVAAPSDDGMTLKVGPEYPPPGANGFSVTCSTLEDPGCDIDIGGKLIVGKAFSEGAPLDGSFAVTYTQMRFPTDNGALPAAATVCAAELRLMTAESFGNADQRNFVGRYCTQSFPIVEANWVESFSADAIAGVSIDAVAAAGAATVLGLDDLSGITSAAKTGLCLGVSGGQPTGMNGAAFEAADTPNSIPPQLWVWFNVEQPTPTPTPPPTALPTCAAIDLGNELPVSANGTTVGAPSAGATSACATGEGTRNDVIYKWTAPATGYYTIEVTAYSWAALLSVRDGGCFGPELACRATPVASRLVVAATLGQSLTIVVGGTSLQGGSYALSISANPPCAYIQLDAAGAVYSSASAATYPPSAPSCVQGATQFSVRHSTDGNDFTVNEAIVQFDTSVLPAGAAVTWGQVVLGDNATNTDNGTLTAEWLDWGGTCDAGDYDRPTQGTAFTVPMADVAAGMQSFALQDFSGVNAGGLTSLRLKIAADEPTGTNELNFTWRYMTLIVCDPSFPDTPTPTATPTRTPTPPLSGCCVVDSQCSLPPEVESTPVGGGTCIDASNAGACSALGCQTAQFVAHDTCDNGCVVPTPCAGEARYWVGGATENHANPTTWNDPAHWSCSSGGTPGASPPQCVAVGDTYQGLNDCVWDANSGLAGYVDPPNGFGFIEASGLCCRNADWTEVGYQRPGANCCSAQGDPPGSPNCNGVSCLRDSDCSAFGKVCTAGSGLFASGMFMGSAMYVSGDMLQGLGMGTFNLGTIYLTATEGSHSLIITDMPTGNGLDFHGSGTYGDHATWTLVEGAGNPQGDIGGTPGANLTFGFGRLNLNGKFLGGYDIRSGHEGHPADAFILDASLGTSNESHAIRVFHSWSLPSTTLIYGDPPCGDRLSLECPPLVFLEPASSCDPNQWTMTFDGADLSYYALDVQPMYPGAEWIVTGTATTERVYSRTHPCIGHCAQCPGMPRPTPMFTMQDGATQRVTQHWDVSGTEEVPLIIRSSNPGTAWTLDCTGALCESDYLILSDSTCIGECYAGSHSVDGGGNTNWFFSDAPPTPTPTITPTWTWAPQSPPPTPTPAPGCCAFAGTNPLGVSCVDNVVVERPVSFEICQYVSHLFLEDAPVLHFNPAVGCDPLGDFSGSCPPPETPLPTPTSTPARCGQLAVFSVAAPSDDGMTLKVGPEYPPPGANGFSVTCSTLEDPGCDIDIGGKLIVGKAFSEGAPLDGSFAVTYTQMRFPTDNGALPAAATVCAAELRLMTAESFGNADQRNFVGRYCTQSFPIVEANWVESFTGDAIAGVSIDAVAAAGAATVLELDDLSGITSAAQTGLCLGVSGGQPTGMNGAAFEASDTPNSIPPQLWVWFQ